MCARPQDVPTHLQLIPVTLQSLHKLGGSASINEILQNVIEFLRIPKDVSAVPHVNSNISELEYRLAWARTYLKKSGLIENSERGVWSLTSEGRQRPDVDPREVSKFVRSIARTARADNPDLVSGLTAVDVGVVSLEEAAAWKSVLTATLLSIKPAAFERLCQRLLRESGFIEVEVTGRSSDGGIDGRGVIRIGGLISFNVLFQSKRYQGSIGPSIVRDFRGAMVGRADKGLIITTGGFTSEAWKEATRDGAPPIDLIDGDFLADKLKELKLGIRTALVEHVEVDNAWFESL